MHDIVDLERRGVPGVFVASTEFVEAAEAQSTALGFPTVARVFIPHPIQDRTDDEMREYADEVYDEIVAAVTALDGRASPDPSVERLATRQLVAPSTGSRGAAVVSREGGACRRCG